MSIKQKLLSFAPILITTFIFLFYHILIQHFIRDDVWFLEIQNAMNLTNYIDMRYHDWTSRTIIELGILFLVRYPLIWKIINTAIFISLPYLICKLTDTTKNNCWFSCFLVLIYPFYDMVSAGWIATTLNTLWPLWCVFYIGMILKKRMTNKNIKWYEYLSGILALIYGANQEQVAVIFLTIFSMFCIAKWMKREYKEPFIYTGITISILSLIYILTCPGNFARSIAEAERFAPEFESFSMIKKLCLGLINVERVFIANINFLYIIVVLAFAILVYKKTHNYWKVLVSAIPLYILFGYTILISVFPRFQKLFFIPEKSFDYQLTNINTLIPIALLLMVIFSLLCSVFWLSSNIREFIFLAILLALGMATAVVMGFSPTLYESADRVFIYLYFALIFVCVWIISKTTKQINFSKTETALWMTACCFLALICIENNLHYCLLQA